MSNILLIDDDKQFVQDFANDAAPLGISISSKNSLEGLKQILPSLAHKYAAVILDIKCLIEPNQAKEDASFIGAALRYLDSNVPDFPRLILTGDDSEFESLRRYYPDELMYLKKPDDKVRLFVQLQHFIQHAEHLRIKREHPLVFDAFDKGLLTPKKEVTLLTILKNINEQNPANFKGIIGDIRDVHEDIYKSLNSRNKSVVPDRFINGNGSPTFTVDFYRHLEGNLDPKRKYQPTTTVYQDSTLLNATKFVQNTCSEFLHGTSKLNYQINPYTIKALINSLLELIVWSKSF